jgi:hypothetical protein
VTGKYNKMFGIFVLMEKKTKTLQYEDKTFEQEINLYEYS